MLHLPGAVCLQVVGWRWLWEAQVDWCGVQVVGSRPLMSLKDVQGALSPGQGGWCPCECQSRQV